MQTATYSVDHLALAFFLGALVIPLLLFALLIGVWVKHTLLPALKLWKEHQAAKEAANNEGDKP